MDCSKCDWGQVPELSDINQEAWVLWNEINTQWRSTAFGLIGLDYIAVAAEAARIGIELTQCNMKKIKALESFSLKQQRKDDDNSDLSGSQKISQKHSG